MSPGGESIDGRRAGPSTRGRTSGRASRRADRSHNSSQWDISGVAWLRAVAYRVFAATLLYPDARRLQWLGTISEELQAYGDTLAAFGFFGAWRRFLDVLLESGEQDLGRLEQEYVRLFSVNTAGLPCFLYESAYVATGGQDTGWLAANLTQAYLHAGLQPDPSLNESPDHVAVELEFMAYLCGQEAEAWERRALDQAMRTLVWQRSFLQHHLGRWLGDFAGAVQTATAEQLYATAANAAYAFVCHDLDLVETVLIDVTRLKDSAQVPGESTGRGMQ